MTHVTLFIYCTDVQFTAHRHFDFTLLQFIITLYYIITVLRWHLNTISLRLLLQPLLIPPLCTKFLFYMVTVECLCSVLLAWLLFLLNSIYAMPVMCTSHMYLAPWVQQKMLLHLIVYSDITQNEEPNMQFIHRLTSRIYILSRNIFKACKLFLVRTGLLCVK